MLYYYLVLYYNNLKKEAKIMFKYIQKLSITLLFLFTANTSAIADIKVVASIKPIHSLASYLMDGVGKPDLIVDGLSLIHI